MQCHVPYGHGQTKATSFLGAEGIDSEMMTKIFVHVKLLKEARKKAVIPTTWENPIAWRRGIPLSCHIDVPMHLVFLGIVKASVATVNEWIACKGWNLIAESGTNVTLDNIKHTNSHLRRARSYMLHLLLGKLESPLTGNEHPVSASPRSHDKGVEMEPYGSRDQYSSGTFRSRGEQVFLASSDAAS